MSASSNLILLKMTFFALQFFSGFPHVLHLCSYVQWLTMNSIRVIKFTFMPSQKTLCKISCSDETPSSSLTTRSFQLYVNYHEEALQAAYLDASHTAYEACDAMS